MRIRAAIATGAGSPLTIDELELAPPRANEVLVDLRASGVCRSDLNVIDGVARAPFPTVLGHEGAGVVAAVGPGVSRVGVGDHVALSWVPYCGRCDECLRELTHLCSAAWPAMGAGKLMDDTGRLSRAGDEVFHYSFLSTFATATVVPEACCVPIARDVPFDVAALVGCAVTTGIGAVWWTAAVRPSERVAVFGCGGVGLSAIIGAVAAGAGPIVAVDVSDAKLADALELGATHAVRAAGSAEEVAEEVQRASGGGVDYAFEVTGRAEVTRAAFLSTRTRGATVLIGIAHEGADVAFPALPFFRMERRVLGCEYGSARPDRDFARILDQHRRGRLPLDRLISHRLPLDGVNDAFNLMRAGESRRAILDLAS